MNSEFSGSLENEVVELRNRVLRIEDALRRRGVVLEETKPRPVAEVASVAQAPNASVASGSAAPVPVAAYAASAPPQVVGVAKPKDGRSLENKIGSQWFNRIGILALLIAAAWFLKFAVDNHWIGPLGRVLIGLVAGSGLIAWSEQFRTKGYAVFSYSLKAVGSGVLYLSLWAAFSLFHLMPAGVAFALMILVTAFNGLMAWVQDAELLALYSIVGGLSTPLLLSTGENHEVALFSYLLLMALAVLVLVVLRPWSRLLFASFTGTVLIMVGWWIEDYTSSAFATTAFFVFCFFMIFAFAPRLVRVKNEKTSGIHGWDALALVVLPVANASLGFLAFYALLDRAETQGAGPWLAVVFAAFYLLLLRLPAQGRLRASPVVLESLHLAAAVVFLTIAIPLKAQGRWLTVGWLVEGAALLWVSGRTKSLLLRVLSVGCLVLGLGALLAVNPSASLTPVFNSRFGSYFVAIAAFAFSTWIAMKAMAEEAQKASKSWRAIAIGASLLVNALILLAVGLEIDNFWRVQQASAEWSQQLELHKMYEQFSDSAWLMLFGAILLAVGFWRRSAFLLWQGLVLLAFSVAKVFLFDMSELSQGYRILSFLGLGALLLAVSFVYQRDWLNLRAKTQEKQEGQSA